MIPPRGFEAERYPLRHQLLYAAGLSAVTVGKNTSMMTVLRHYAGGVVPDTIDVNPHNTNYVQETGMIVKKMSIIDKLRIKLDYSYTEDAAADKIPIKCWWQPIIFSFPEKLDAADEDTGTTVATILQLLKDATQEDVTPLFNNIKHDTNGLSDKSHPLTTVNTTTETIGMLNLDTDTTSEGITWDDDLMQNAMQRYTNKGALKACIGRRRFFTLSPNHTHQSYFINKPVPRAIRRIVPYSFMTILTHIPLPTEEDAYYYSQSPTINIAYVGVKAKIRYHEWNIEHNQSPSET